VRDRPVVSVITPTLNQARFLERMLASLRAQTCPAFEHLVIDGGSTDGTLEILAREAALGRLQWVSQPDAGMYDAINKGLSRASGEILAYLNSDDAWFPWSLETVVGAFAARPDADLVFGDGVKLKEDTGSQRLRLFGPFDRVSLANYESLMQPAVFWRRRVYERLGGFDADMRYVADLDYWLRASAAGSTLVHVREMLAIERIHASRLSSAHEEPMAAENREMRARHAGLRAGPAARARAFDRDERWQQWLWLRFLVSYAIRPFGAPWRRFFRSGQLAVRGRQVIQGIPPHHHQHLWGSVTSGLAAQILVGTPAKRQTGRARLLLQRARLVVLVLPLILQARRSVPREPPDGNLRA
jgi:glycosyltransferase involved in cell wall biosynthesis